MGNQSLGETLAGTSLLVAGLKANMDKLKRRGLDSEFVSAIEALNQDIHSLNAEQEALKSRLKEKTAQLDDSLASLKTMSAEARKVVKLELAQASWKEFGISDVK